jgi:hypothetical protein
LEAATSRRAIRATARRRRSQRGAAIAALSTVAVIGGLAAIVVTSPGWSNVQETFFSWPDFKRVFPDVLAGFWLDVRMFCVIEVVVLVLGLVVALTRTSHAPALFPLRMLAAVYTDLLRGVPTILLVFLIGFGMPALELEGCGPAPSCGAARRRRSRTRPTWPRSPRRDRLDPPEPALGRAGARPDRVADAAPRRAAAGDPARTSTPTGCPAARSSGWRSSARRPSRGRCCSTR